MFPAPVVGRDKLKPIGGRVGFFSEKSNSIATARPPDIFASLMEKLFLDLIFPVGRPQQNPFVVPK
jgi:hypothetical protein